MRSLDKLCSHGGGLILFFLLLSTMRAHNGSFVNGLQAPRPESTPHSAFLQGQLQVGGQRFSALCDCNAPTTQLTGQGYSASALLCNPTKIIISVDHGNQGLAPEAIRRFYGQPRDIALVDTHRYHFACMDDRITTPSLMTMGGDLGEFLLAMMILSRLGEARVSSNSIPSAPLDLSEDQVVDILGRYVNEASQFRRFYHCNEDAAATRLERVLGLIGLDLKPSMRLQRAPPPEHIPKLLAALSDPLNHGDIHLRSILANAEHYHLVGDQAARVIRAFYRILWDQGNTAKPFLFLDLLPGERSPQAFIEVDEGEACSNAQKAALLQPRRTKKGETASAYMIHTSAVAERRRELAQFLFQEAQRLGVLTSVNSTLTSEDIYHRLDKYSLQWLESTVTASGAHLKFYRMLFQ